MRAVEEVGWFLDLLETSGGRGAKVRLDGDVKAIAFCLMKIKE